MPNWFRRPNRVAEASPLTTNLPYLRVPPIQPPRGKPIVTSESLMSVPPLYAALRVLTTSVASLPLETPDGDVIDVSPRTSDHLLARPTAHDTKYSFFESIMMNLAFHGNAFIAFTALGRDGMPSQLEVIHPDNVTPAYNRYGTEATFDEGYWIDSYYYGPEDIIHIKELTEGGYSYGISRLRVAAAAIGLMISEQEHVVSTFNDGAQPTGYWKQSKGVYDQLTGEKKEPAQRHIEQVTEFVAGRGNGVLAVGDGWEWEQVAMTHADIQLLESRQWSASQAAALFGVPPHLIGASTQDSETYSNVQQDLALFDTVTLARYKQAIWQEFALHGIDFRFGVSELSLPPLADRVAAMSAAIQAGICSPAQAAEHLGWQPPDGDTTPAMPAGTQPRMTLVADPEEPVEEAV